MVTLYLIFAALFFGSDKRRLARLALRDRFRPDLSADAATGEQTKTMIMSQMAQAIAASASSVMEFYFPRAARVQRYFGVSSVAEAAHTTQASDLTFVNAGTDGAGSATLCTLTNDSDLASSSVRVGNSAWVAHDAKELITIARPGLLSTDPLNVMDAILAGQVVKCTHAKAAGTTTGNMIAGIEFVWSS